MMGLQCLYGGEFARMGRFRYTNVHIEGHLLGNREISNFIQLSVMLLWTSTTKVGKSQITTNGLPDDFAALAPK